MNPCRKCGGCCSPVIVSEDLEGIDAANAPAGWIKKHWQSAGEREGYFGYWCDLFDFETHLCKDYKNRPAVCRDYPFYGRDIAQDNIADDCGYAITMQKSDGARGRNAAVMP